MRCRWIRCWRASNSRGADCDFVARTEVIKDIGIHPVSQDAKAKLGPQLAEFLNELVVLQPGGDDQFPSVCPPGIAERLEKVLAVGIVSDFHFQFQACQGERRQAEGAFQVQLPPVRRMPFSVTSPESQSITAASGHFQTFS